MPVQSIGTNKFYACKLDCFPFESKAISAICTSVTVGCKFINAWGTKIFLAGTLTLKYIERQVVAKWTFVLLELFFVVQIAYCFSCWKHIFICKRIVLLYLLSCLVWPLLYYDVGKPFIKELNFQIQS